MVSSNLGNVISMLAAGVLLPFLPMLPAQVLAQNLCFDASQLAFAFDRPDPEAYRRPSALRPRAFTRYVCAFGLLNAAADLATFAVLALVDRGSLTAGGQTAFMPIARRYRRDEGLKRASYARSAYDALETALTAVDDPRAYLRSYSERAPSRSSAG